MVAGVLLLVPGLASAQLPLPVIPDWLRPSQGDAGILNQTHVTLTGNNYTIVQQNVMARSRGFKILGLISIRSPSYTEAMSRLYAKAHVKDGHSQALANIVHEKTSSNFILFSIPKVRIRADLIEFEGDEEQSDSAPMPTLLSGKKRR